MNNKLINDWTYEEAKTAIINLTACWTRSKDERIYELRNELEKYLRETDNPNFTPLMPTYPNQSTINATFPNHEK